jgi:DNA-directed RNA polymerase specialized sigma24 family protein
MNDIPEPPDEELLQRMRRKQEDFPAAREAWGVFFKRHVQFLYRCVASADRVLAGRGIGTDDIVEATFTKVWESAADGFRIPDGLAPEAAGCCCQAWLATIARNLVRDKLKTRKPELVDPDEKEELFPQPGTPVEQCLGMYDLVAGTLSERDAAIIWFKIRYYNPGTGQSQPPREVHDAFCREWGITPDVLRKAYDRALKLLAEAYTPTAR